MEHIKSQRYKRKTQIHKILKLHSSYFEIVARYKASLSILQVISFSNLLKT